MVHQIRDENFVTKHDDDLSDTHPEPITAIVTVTGNGSMNVSKTIYIARVEIAAMGNGGTSGVGTQIIANSMKVTGCPVRSGRQVPRDRATRRRKAPVPA